MNVAQILSSTPGRIALIVVVTVLVVLVGRAVFRLVTSHLGRLAGKRGDGNGARIEARLNTVRSVLNSSLTGTAVLVCGLMILSELGLNIGPLLASAGVAGVVLGFGAQTVVRDLLAGLFMLTENQLGVGDRVELGGPASTLAAGTVEAVALRVTSVRDDDGRLWYVRNGEILRVANETHGWALAVVDVTIAPAADTQAATDAFDEVSATLKADPAYSSAILDEPVVRVRQLLASGTTMRWVVRTQPGQQDRVASAMRRRLPAQLAANGVTLGEGA